MNYQCKFSENIDGNLVGMQREADFTDVIDLDRYLIYDEKDLFVSEFFGQLLYNHLGAEFEWDLGIDEHQKVHVIKRLFTQESAFTELVHAAEGNCRDFICIFSKAFLEEYKRSQSSKSISIPEICNASASWFSSQKESNIKAESVPQATLSFLLNDVLKKYKSRSFLVETGKDEHPRLVRLLNERIIHRLNEVYSHPDKPGLRYEIFTLDHGAYVRYRGTVNEPKPDIFYRSGSAFDPGSDEAKSIVPLDDKRSIRRIVFDPDRLTIAA